MYEEHWGLSGSPFTSGLDPKLFHESPPHAEALARLKFLVEYRRRVGLLLAESGAGKSLLLEVFARDVLQAGGHVARVSLLGLDADQMLWRVADAVNLNPRIDATVLGLWRTLGDYLTENRYQQIDTVVLLDDADDADPEVFTQIMRLAHLDPSPDSRLILVLAADARRVGRLPRRLLDICELRIDLEPWDAEMTAEYLRCSLARAGCENPVFDEDALTRLFELTDGMPRKVSQLAQLALLAGAGQQLERIDPQTVETVHEELGV